MQILKIIEKKNDYSCERVTKDYNLRLLQHSSFLFYFPFFTNIFF